MRDEQEGRHGRGRKRGTGALVLDAELMHRVCGSLSYCAVGMLSPGLSLCSCDRISQVLLSISTVPMFSNVATKTPCQSKNYVKA